MKRADLTSKKSSFMSKNCVIDFQKNFLKLFRRRREGVALILALVVMLVGGALAALIFEMGLSFSSTTRRQRDHYTDHTTGTNYIQEAVAYITKTNNDAGKVVLHRPPLSVEDRTVKSLEGIRFRIDEISRDVREGRNRITVNVYDVSYDDIDDSLKNKLEEMRELPPPLNLYYTKNGGAAIMEVDGDGAITNDKLPHRKENSWRDILEHYGAYVVRMRLFRTDETGHEKWVRTIDQGFFQIVSDDP